MIFLLPDTILDLLRLSSRLASPTTLQALACFLMLILANFANSSSEGAKTQKIYNYLNLIASKKHFVVLNKQQKKLFFFLCTNFFVLSRKQPKITQKWTFLQKKMHTRCFFLDFSESVIISMLIFCVALAASKCFF